MSRLGKLSDLSKRIIELLYPRDKRTYELKYWRGRSKAEGGKFGHAHYLQFYTTIFELTFADFDRKRILDIGCGPRGSLEWADMALERVGLDPLANDYVKLRTEPHKMSYVAATSEYIPFADGHFDVVTSFNSLDHVDDMQKTISEIKRVTKSGSVFLLIVEINHPPTPTEPITLGRESLELFMPEFGVHKSWISALLPRTHDVYGSVLAAKAPSSNDDPAILCARMTRK